MSKTTTKLIKSGRYFTGSVFHNNHESIADIKALFHHRDIEHVWCQLERGAKNGTLHWQYTFKSKKSTTKGYFWKALGFVKGEYIDVAKKSLAVIAYAQKSDTRVEGPYDWDIEWDTEHEKKVRKLENELWCMDEDAKRLNQWTIEHLVNQMAEEQLSVVTNLSHYDHMNNHRLRIYREEIARRKTVRDGPARKDCDCGCNPNVKKQKII